MRILYVGHRYKGHSKNGGYDYITEYDRGGGIVDCLYPSQVPLGFIPQGFHGKRLNLIILDFVARIRAKRYDVIHYFYAELAPRWKAPKQHRALFVATVHLASERFTQKQWDILKSFDKVICLSTSEERRLCDKGVNAFFVPHGFNTPEFTFTATDGFDPGNINVFYSGMNYRNFDTFLKIARFCAEKNKAIRFYAVGQSAENKEQLAGLENVVVCPRLSDDAYYSLLSSCDYNFLPLTFATANNALLEAQSLGVVSILPDIAGVTDYADKEHNLFYSASDVAGLERMFLTLRKTENSASLKAFSKRFAWEEIYKKLEVIYTERT